MNSSKSAKEIYNLLSLRKIGGILLTLILQSALRYMYSQGKTFIQILNIDIPIYVLEIIVIFLFGAIVILILWPLIGGQYTKDREEIKRLRKDNERIKEDNELVKESIKWFAETQLRELNSSSSIYNTIMNQAKALREKKRKD